jgi:hypothetical protein
MTVTDTTSAKALLALFRDKFPKIEDFVLNANAEVIAAKKPEGVAVITRVLTNSSGYEGADYQLRLIRDILMVTRYDSDGRDADLLNEEVFRDDIASFWSSTLLTEFARMHAFRSTAHELNMTMQDMIVSDATTNLFHDRMLKPFTTESDTLSEWYWRGIALLHVYIRDEVKRDALTPLTTKDFVWWVGEQDDFKVAADLFMERQTIDVDQLDELMRVRTSLTSALTTGAL